MSLSLELKKFINSDCVGKYADIVLPAVPQPVNSKEKRKAKPKAEDVSAEPQAEPKDAPQEEPQQPQGGERVRIHYMEEGNGEPMILVHSIGQSLYTWRNLFNRLSLHYRVIAIDLPGHGYSGRPENFDYTIEEQAVAIDLFMDAIGIESAHFMAFSMGSNYVLRLAMTHPYRMGRIILLAPGGMSHEMPLMIKLLDSSLFGAVAAMLYGVRTVENVLTECYFDLAQTLNEDVVTEYYKTISDQQSRRAVRASLHNFDDADVMSKLRMLEMPILMIQGSEDKWRTSEHIELYHAAISSAGYTQVRNAGHLVHEEKPDKIIAATLEFIPVLCPE